MFSIRFYISKITFLKHKTTRTDGILLTSLRVIFEKENASFYFKNSIEKLKKNDGSRYDFIFSNNFIVIPTK